jgi:hypothetical protein
VSCATVSATVGPLLAPVGQGAIGVLDDVVQEAGELHLRA